MDREEVLAIIKMAIEANIQRAGVIGIPVVTESSEEIAIEVIDALESAGFTITRQI